MYRTQQITLMSVPTIDKDHLVMNIKVNIFCPNDCWLRFIIAHWILFTTQLHIKHEILQIFTKSYIVHHRFWDIFTKKKVHFWRFVRTHSGGWLNISFSLARSNGQRNVPWETFQIPALKLKVKDLLVDDW